MPPRYLHKVEPSRRAFLQQAIGAMAVATAGGCRFSGAPSVPVVLFVMDTVRARNCGAWGYGRNTTPHLDALATQSTRYEQAITPAPWTLPAHVGIFTGRYTLEHGVRGYVYNDEKGERRIRENALPDAFECIAETLFHVGYNTAAFSANTGYMAPYFNLAQGFETYHLERIPGTSLVDKALAWQAAQTKPTFLFCNVMDAHRPYNLTPCPDTLPEPVSEELGLLDQLREKTLEQPENLDEGLVEKVTAQYDRGIANADKALGNLIAGLKAQGRYDETLLIVCADHGEYLGEHGLVEHSKDVYQEAVHVPLVAKLPYQTASSIHGNPVSLTQVPGTILAHTGVSGEAYPPSLTDDAARHLILTENYYSRDWDFTDARWPGRFDRIRRAVYDGKWKYIQSSDGDEALYRLDIDPQEYHNMASREPERMEVLRKRCVAIVTSRLRRSADGMSDVSPVPEKTQEALDALGYL